MSSATMSKKNKGKKAADPNETSKLLAAKISQLEQDAAGEKDQEVEIGTPLCLFRIIRRVWGIPGQRLTGIFRQSEKSRRPPGT
jgi:hypothetical protein